MKATVDSKYAWSYQFSGLDFHLVNDDFPRMNMFLLLQFFHRKKVRTKTEVTYEKINRTWFDGLLNKHSISWRWVIHGHD
ncbi:hypothetical protein VDIAB_100121 [Vibrio diabolicus]|nr:hypothetical protein VDIAB_100121 [Vibrio diabolicus]